MFNFLYLTHSNLFFMNLLQEVISSLTKEESRFFKLYAERTNSTKERKDLMLFDQLRKSDITEEKLVNILSYGNSKNAYYRLKNRLLFDISKSLVLQHLNNEEDVLILHNLLLFRIFRQKQKNRVAEVFLKKAEKKQKKMKPMSYSTSFTMNSSSFHRT